MPKRATRGILLLSAIALFSFAGITSSKAYDHEAWSHDNHGYWDDHHRYHHFSTYHNHQGYWRQNTNGVRIWINI